MVEAAQAAGLLEDAAVSVPQCCMLLQGLPSVVLAGDAFGGAEHDAHPGVALVAAILCGEAAAEALGAAMI